MHHMVHFSLLVKFYLPKYDFKTATLSSHKTSLIATPKEPEMLINKSNISAPRPISDFGITPVTVSSSGEYIIVLPTKKQDCSD